MKNILLFTIFVLTGTYCFSQKYFTLNCPIPAMSVRINGQEYQIDSIGTKIETNFPKFDTLTFQYYKNSKNTPILCNFKPDTIYTILLGCCDAPDIYPTSKLKNDSLDLWDYEKDFLKVQNQLMDKPFISIRTKRDSKDSIYAWHADFACETEYKLIKSSLWRLGIPPKCFYWNNITTIQFFKSDEKIIKQEKSNLEEFLGLKNIVELSSISFRLFDNERFIIIFDEKSNNITLQYE